MPSMGKKGKGQSSSHDSSVPEFESSKRLTQSIEALLEDLRSKLNFRLDDTVHPLQRIYQWCNELLSQHHSLTLENSTLKASLETATAEAKALRTEKSMLTAGWDSLLGKASKWESQVNTLEQELGKARTIIAETSDHHEKGIRKVLEREESKQREAQQQHKTEIDRQIERYNGVVRECKNRGKQIEELQGEKREAEDKIKNLERIVARVSDRWAITTDKILKEKFGTISQKITNIVGTLAPHLQYAHESFTTFDRTGFLKRPRKRQPYDNFLRHLLWSTLVECLFSQNGFGSFGPASALSDLHHALFSLLKSSDTAYPDDSRQALHIILDRDINQWRWSTLQLVKNHLEPQYGSTAVSSLYKANVQQVSKKMLDVLNSLCSLPVEIVTEVGRVVELSAELAVELGVQRAQLNVFSPSHGTRIAIGNEFRTSRGSDQYASGAEILVDLVVCPSLRRVGDGHDDLNALHVICQGEVYALALDQ